jgi:hypothetical protein
VIVTRGLAALPLDGGGTKGFAASTAKRAAIWGILCGNSTVLKFWIELPHPDRKRWKYARDPESSVNSFAIPHPHRLGCSPEAVETAWTWSSAECWLGAITLRQVSHGPEILFVRSDLVEGFFTPLLAAVPPAATSVVVSAVRPSPTRRPGRVVVLV